MKKKIWLLAVVAIILLVLVVWCYQNYSMNETMRIVSVQPFNSGQYSTDPSLTQIGPNNIKILFKGPVTIMGNYFFEANESGFVGYCMKDFDISFLGVLPYGISPEEVQVFCFRNADIVEKKLGKQSKEIAVTIDNFELKSYPAEVMNWADFVDVKF